MFYGVYFIRCDERDKWEKLDPATSIGVILAFINLFADTDHGADFLILLYACVSAFAKHLKL